MAVLPTGIGPVTGYNIERSLRFNSADSTYLNRTPASASNRKTWTYSAWIKRTNLSSLRSIFGTYITTNNLSGIDFTAGDAIEIFQYNASYNFQLLTTPVFRDPSSWYHIVVAFDTTQATNSNRIKLYVNGTQITVFSTASYPSLNYDAYWNNNIQHDIARRNGNAYWDGYQTEVNFIDGQALTPSSFGQTNASTGVWETIKYTGTYGTNGFYLNFSDNSSTTSTTLGKDSSGNGNNWTPNNFSVTAGVGNDSMVDSPTAYGTDTGVGGSVRGNYCTLNAAAVGITALSNGNLQFNYNETYSAQGTIGVTSGKWYFEGVLTTQVTAEQVIGVVNQSWVNSTTLGANANGWGIIVQSNANNGQAYHNGSVTSSYATFANGDIAMVAFDVDSGKIWFGRNGTWFNSGAPASGTGQIYSNLSGTIFPAFNNKNNSGGVLYANFGQRAFAYTAPAGFKCLVSTNLPVTNGIGASASTQASDYFNPVLYTGTGASLSVTGVGFQPDLTWIKGRSGATNHSLYDAVRGVQKQLESNTTTAETTQTTGLTTFGSDGFTVGSLAQINTNTATYVAWNWNAGGSTVTNTAGTISAQVRANTTSGCSIVSFAFPAVASKTVGHGLGVAPSMVIVKSRSNGTQQWITYHASTGNTGFLCLNKTDAFATNSSVWDNTSPTSTVFTLGSGFTSANYGADGIAYCFAPIDGFSAFGSYTGNGSADGPYIYTNFLPAYVLVKRTNTTGNWQLYDATRDPYNVVDLRLQPNLANAEASGTTSALLFADFVSNGFKIRGTDTDWNASGSTYVYAAFAEFPFKYSRAF